MTLLVYDPFVLEHHTGTGHPESSERIKYAWTYLINHNVIGKCQLLSVTTEPHRSLDSVLSLVHSPNYIKELKDFCYAGGGRIEIDTVVSKNSFDVAYINCSKILAAIDSIMRGPQCNAFCLIRPPGHHALTNAAMGFCLLNQVAVAAQYLKSHYHCEHIMIIDWDVHHGNGTQEIFYEDPSVFYFSIHRHPFYPGTGSADETGAGPGRGTTLNIPITYDTSRNVYLDLFRIHIEKSIQMFRPDFIIISCGFDAHRCDPIGSLKLESWDYALLTEIVADMAADYCQGRILSVLEGGYHPHYLAESLEYHIGVLIKHDT